MQAVQTGEQQRRSAAQQQLNQRQQRSADLRRAHLREIRLKAGDESMKVGCCACAAAGMHVVCMGTSVHA